MFSECKVCSGNDNNFVVINQKGIDPPSLELLARAGVSEGFLYALLLYAIPIVFFVVNQYQLHFMVKGGASVELFC